tara:strand:- start:272 stop:1177 length:906 start_codon:yes stop_codon:yes gene_type:complete
MTTVTLTLNRIKNVEAQKQQLMDICKSKHLFHSGVPANIQNAIAKDVNIYYYDTNLSMRVAHQQDQGVIGAGNCLTSNYNYAMNKLVPVYDDVTFVHAMINATTTKKPINHFYSVVKKWYSKDFFCELMFDHSNGYHKQVPYLLYTAHNTVKEIKTLKLKKTTMVEKYEGWMLPKCVRERCLDALKSRLHKTPFCDKLVKEGVIFRSINNNSQVTGQSKRCYDNVLFGPSDATIYLGVIVESFGVIPHAWLVQEGKVLEMTPNHEGRQLYFGVPVDREEYVKRKTENTRQHDMFDVYVLDL